ncbi:putative NudC domain-containing protein [Naja naja]|nr:putative NudC domain-containing protein [Naja naja]
MSAPFEERSGLVPCATPWGCWYQTMEEVFVEVNVPQGTRARDVECSLKSRHLALTVAGKEVLKGNLFDSTIADEATWTLEVENPGFDFSGAEISGNYTKGGPDFSSLER